MAYEGNELGSLRFLAGNLMYQVTARMMQGGNQEDIDALDDATLLMDVISSYYTEKDKKFKEEWVAIQQARQEALEAGYLPGENDPAKDLDFRFRELKAMFRSLCRSGVFVELAAPKTTWEPTP